MSRANEPAYPMIGGSVLDNHGLTIREAFVMAAPASEIEAISPATVEGFAAMLGITDDEYRADCSGNYLRVLAKLRCMWADATLAAMEALRQ